MTTHTSILSTCPLHTSRGYGKRETHINWLLLTCKMAAPVTGTTLRTTGLVPADSRKTKFSGAYGDRGLFIFSFQLNTSRNWQPHPVDPYSPIYDDHTHEDQCEWHRMTRMTGPDCAVVCNLINTQTHTTNVAILRCGHERIFQCLPGSSLRLYCDVYNIGSASDK